MSRSKHRYRLFIALSLLFMLAAVILPAPAHAQNGDGSNNITFWDDTPTPANPHFKDPSIATTEGVYYLNADGGRTTDDGLFIVINRGRIQIVRDRDTQIYNRTNPGMFWMMTTNIGGEDWCFTERTLAITTSHACNTTDVDAGFNQVDWSVMTTPAGPNLMTYYHGVTPAVTATLNVIYSYDDTRPEVLSMMAAVAFSDGTPRDVKLYLAGDMYLDGDDMGAGVYQTYQGKNVVAQVGATAVGGIRVAGQEFTSYLADEYNCVFGNPVCDSTVSGKRGPGAGEPYPNYANPDESTDIGIAAHWDRPLSFSGQNTAELIFLSREAWDEATATDDGNGAEEDEVTTPAYCNTPPTLTIKPDSSELASGAATTVWVELANLCRDLPTAPADVLLSFSDGMQVTETSPGAVNLGQRAAMQRLSLPADATYGWYAIVRNNGLLTAAPLAVAEIYAGAAVVRSTDFAFTVPAVTVPAVTAPAAPVTAPADPAPLPVSLPNTAGDQPINLPPTAVILLGLVLISSAWLMLRTTRRG